VTQLATAHPVSVHGQPTALFIGEADPATEARAEDAVFLNQIRDARVPLVGPPAGHGHHEESNRSDIHDGGSLPHPPNVELETASAEKWDTTGVTRCRCVARGTRSTLTDEQRQPDGAIIEFVRCRVRRLFVAVLLVICIGAPIVEMFDQWDHTPQDGNDTEADLVLVVLCIGVGLLSAASVLRRIRSYRFYSGRVVLPLARFAKYVNVLLVLPVPNSSPPTTLRI